MRELISCPRSGHKSSKRVVSLVCCAMSVILGLTLTALIIFRPNMSIEPLKLLSSIIGVFVLAAGGVQATAMGGGNKNTGRQDYAEPTSYTDR